MFLTEYLSQPISSIHPLSDSIIFISSLILLSFFRNVSEPIFEVPWSDCWDSHFRKLVNELPHTRASNGWKKIIIKFWNLESKLLNGYITRLQPLQGIIYLKMNLGGYGVMIFIWDVLVFIECLYRKLIIWVHWNYSRYALVVYYLIQFAFHFQSFVYLFWEVKRDDFKQMFIHHFVTAFVIIASYYGG